MKKVISLSTFAFLLFFFGHYNSNGQIQPSNTETITRTSALENAMPSVVSVLSGKGDGLTLINATGIIIRKDGVILTSYEAVKNATQVQIRLSNGEIYDKVDLLAFDERRNVAALKIAGSDLPEIAVNRNEIAAGSRCLTISNAQGQKQSISDGLISGIRMADDIPGAGNGYRLIQFSAPIAPGSSGGLLTDEQGKAIGIIVGTLPSGQTMNFAVPIGNVNGLADANQKVMSFASGASLATPKPIRPPTANEIVTTDRNEILKNAKILYVFSPSELITDEMMERRLLKAPEFKNWGMVIVESQNLADLIIRVEHVLFTWDYTYSVTDRKTSIVLGSGKVTVWDGNRASDKFTKKIIALLKDAKEPKPGAERKEIEL